MRVLTVNPFYAPLATGSSVVSRQLSSMLADAGHEVCVLTSTTEARVVHETIDEIPVVRLPSRALNLGHWSFNYDLPFVLRRRITKEIEDVVEDFNPDVIHLHGQFWDLCVLTGVVARRRNVPVVLSVHTAMVSDRKAIGAAVAVVDSTAVRVATRYSRAVWTGYDKRVLDYIRRRYGVSDPQFLPNPTNTAKFQAGDAERGRELIGLGDAPIILSVGHVIPLRDRIRLIRALPEIIRRCPTANVVVAGEVYDRRFLDEATDLGVADHVKCLGRVPHDDMPDLIAAATVESHDLDFHGIGVATQEVMAAGVPCVFAMGSDQFPGVDFDRYPDLAMLDSNAPAVIAHAITEILEDDAKRRKVGVDGQRLCADVFSEGVVLNRLLGIYDKALQSSRAQS
jgi:glycosyltransferase involved in cell wall biosynthesis